MCDVILTKSVFLIVAYVLASRFVAERGSSRLLDHVEHLDKVYNIPPAEGAKSPEAINNVVPIPAIPQLR